MTTIKISVIKYIFTYYCDTIYPNMLSDIIFYDENFKILKLHYRYLDSNQQRKNLDLTGNLDVEFVISDVNTILKDNDNEYCNDDTINIIKKHNYNNILLNFSNNKYEILLLKFENFFKFVERKTVNINEFSSTVYGCVN